MITLSFKKTWSKDLKKQYLGTNIDPNNNNLDCMNNPTFRNINRMFLQLFKAGQNDATRSFLLTVKYNL